MKPPWVDRPNLPCGSTRWRMGGGEDYYNAFYRWFSRLTPDERAAYIDANPEPADWAGVYGAIAKHPWIGD